MYLSLSDLFHQLLTDFCLKETFMVTLAFVTLALGVSAHMSFGYVNAEATFQRVLTPVIPSKLQKPGETLQFGN